jgi:hypothetical protein
MSSMVCGEIDYSEATESFHAVIEEYLENCKKKEKIG